MQSIYDIASANFSNCVLTKLYIPNASFNVIDYIMKIKCRSLFIDVTVILDCHKLLF